MNEGATDTTPSTNCEGESKTAADYEDTTVNVRIKDSSKSMPHFINLHKNGLRRSPRLNKEKPVHENEDLLCSMFTHINYKTESMLNKPKKQWIAPCAPWNK